jgi:hypothetical protein
MKQYFHDPVYAPVEGDVVVPELPGLGLALAEEHRRNLVELE